MVADFIYGRMVGASDAAYLVGCSVTLCCEPSILAFTCSDQASSFQQGFGGEIMDLAAGSGLSAEQDGDLLTQLTTGSPGNDQRAAG